MASRSLFSLLFLTVLLQVGFVLSTSSAESWAQSEDHEVYNLFRRKTSEAAVGSSEWMSAYPAWRPAISLTPPEWTAALKKAVDTGKIPNIPPSSLDTGSPRYPVGVNGSSPEVCSAHGNFGCHAPGEIYDAPDGHIGIGFDDGPIANASPELYTLLKSLNQTSTHFVIGSAIRNESAAFIQAYEGGGDFALHTWSHPYMSALSNEDVLAEFGWTFQIIHDLTGRIPKFWRPPYGDVDARVRAIATQVFGLTAIIWNQDPWDWAIGSGDTTEALVISNMTVWINGPKSPGLIMLEHEHSSMTVGAFKAAHELMKLKEWETVSVARLVPSVADKKTGVVYWNAANGNEGTPDAAVSFLDTGLINKP